MNSKLESLRNKPEHVKRSIAFWASFGITAIIFVFWLGSITGFNSSLESKVADVVNKAGSPTQSLVAGVGSLFGDIYDSVMGSGKVSYTNNIEVSPGK